MAEICMEMIILLKRHATTIYKFILKLKEYICYKVKQHESIKQFLLVCKRTTLLYIIQ